MKPELEQKFYDRWPNWFRGKNESERVNLMCFGFSHGDGWFDLEWRLCEALEKVAPPEYKLMQIKEKFGTLRWYADYGSEATHRLETEAEIESAKTCEQCGKPGELSGKNWVSTLCPDCQVKFKKNPNAFMDS
jgi:hypothetical protein